MIVDSEGLSAIKTDKQYNYLTTLLRHSFHADPYEILLSMTGMKQYFLFHRGKPVAVVSLRDKGHLHCTGKKVSNMVYNVATHPSYRNRGYMKKLLLHIIDTSKQQGKRHLHLEVLQTNKNAISLYKKLGFQVVGGCGGIDWMRIDLKKKKEEERKLYRL